FKVVHRSLCRVRVSVSITAMFIVSSLCYMTGVLKGRCQIAYFFFFKQKTAYEMTPLVEGGEVIEGLGDRVLGRVALEDIRDPFSNRVIVQANEEINEDKVAEIEDAGLERVKIRSVLTCQSRQGVCVRCYGRDLARGH